MEYKDVQVSPVTQLYEPTDGQSVTLVASSTASLFLSGQQLKPKIVVRPCMKLFLIKKTAILQIRSIV